MQRTLALTTLLVFVLGAQTAGAAITFSADARSHDGHALDALLIGSLVTFDVTIRSDGEATLGFAASAFGYDPNVLRFVSGTSVPKLFSDVCLPTGCFGGIDNLLAGALVEDGSDPLAPRVPIANAYTIAPTMQTGANDLGVGGIAGGPQFQLLFELVGIGATTVEIGIDTRAGEAVILAGGVIGEATNALVDVAVIPEPGSALLIGLGLAALGMSGRRSREPIGA